MSYHNKTVRRPGFIAALITWIWQAKTPYGQTVLTYSARDDGVSAFTSPLPVSSCLSCWDNPACTSQPRIHIYLTHLTLIINKKNACPAIVSRIVSWFSLPWTKFLSIVMKWHSQNFLDRVVSETKQGRDTIEGVCIWVGLKIGEIGIFVVQTLNFETGQG